jgi:hypothetical protein
MRYRGPYELDKFSLNIFNYVNYVNDYIYDINNTADSYKTLKELQDEIDKVFYNTVGDYQLSDQIYKDFIMLDIVHLIDKESK